MQIYKIINSILQSCTYILSSDISNEVLLIDCGDIQPILNYLHNEKKIPIGIFLTHSHYDHIYSLADLLTQYPSVIVYASAGTIDGLQDPDMNMSYLYDEDYKVSLPIENRIVVEDGQSVSILGEQVVCIATPGHDTDCVSYMIGNKIFTGDSYNPKSEVFAKWSRSDVQLAVQNEQRIQEMIVTKGLEVYPGHQID